MAPINGTNGDDTINGTSGDDFIKGKKGDDLLYGLDGNDTLHGDQGSDTLHGGAGDDNLDGKDGFDTALYDGSIFDYNVQPANGNKTTVVDLNTSNGDDGTDLLERVEAIEFDDYTLFLDGTNNGPLIVGGDQTTNEDNSVSFTIDAYDFDGDAITLDNLSITGAGVLSLVTTTPLSPAFGTGTRYSLVFDPDGQYESLAEGETATETITIQVNDGVGGVVIQTFDITITGVNDAPVAADDTFTVDEDTQLTGNVLLDNGAGVDSDIDGDALSVVAEVITTANGGTVVLNADGTFTYDPAENFNGTDSFEYTLTDGSLTDTATVTITVNAVNDAPVAVDDDFTVAEDTQLTGNVLLDNGNGADFDVDGPSLTVVAATITTAEGGTVVLNADGTFTYDPPADYAGPDSFEYTVTDGTLTDTATVSINVTPVNDPPVAQDDEFTVDEDTQLFGCVLEDNGFGSDEDIDSPVLSVVPDTITTANGGTVVLNADGTFTYDPAENFNGTDTFVYTLTDGDLTDTATVTINVTAVNDAPDAADDSATTPVDTAVDISVLLNDTDVENDTLSVESFTQPENGTVVETSPGVFTYTPDAGFSGLDAFTYTIGDGNGGFDTATVFVTVGTPPANTAPTALDANIEATIEDGVPNVLTIDFNTLTVNGQPIVSDMEQLISQLDITSLVIQNGERLGVAFVETSPGSKIFTLDLDALNVGDGEFRELVVEYTVDDGQATDNTATGLINLTIDNPDDTPVNTPPVAGDATISQTEEDGLITINLAAAGGLATDADGDPLTVTSLVFTDEFGNELEIDVFEVGGTGESGGIVTIDPTVFGLANMVLGTFLLNYTVSDGTDSASGVVTLNITGSDTNTAPTTIPGTETRTIPDDIVLSSNNIEFDLNQFVSDVDLDPLSITLVSITDASGVTIPIVDPLNDVVGGDGVVTGTIIDGVVSINVAELELEPGETIDFVINYTVSDGIAPPVDGTLDVTVIGPDPAPVGSFVEDFESFSSDTGSSIVLTDLAGLNFDGSAVVIEVDEAGDRAAPGLIAGETTVEQSETVPDGNAAIIEGDLIGFNATTGLPEYAFTVYAPGATLNLDAGSINLFPSQVESFFGTAFDLESMSLTALSGETTVTIIPYRVELIGTNQYQYVAVGEFDVTVDSTAATLLDFTTGDFFDTLIFDDPLTTGVTEMSALENIVAFQIVTTGTLAPANSDDPLNTDTVPVFDQFLVIDDLVFEF